MYDRYIFTHRYFTAEPQPPLNFVALRNTGNTLQKSAKLLIINNLTADKILSVTKSCQQFFRP